MKFDSTLSHKAYNVFFLSQVAPHISEEAHQYLLETRKSLSLNTSITEAQMRSWYWKRNGRVHSRNVRTIASIGNEEHRERRSNQCNAVKATSWNSDLCKSGWTSTGKNANIKISKRDAAIMCVRSSEPTPCGWRRKTCAQNIWRKTLQGIKTVWMH